MGRTLIAIPTYNEKENIAQMIDTLLEMYKKFDILVIDDNSPDGTATIVQGIIDRLKYEHQAERVFLMWREKKEGLGKAYIAGFRWALQRNYDYIFEMDADFSHDPKDLQKLYETLHYQVADLVIGSRYIQGVNVVNWPLSRLILSYMASKYVYLITRMPVKDPTAGFVGYSSKVLSSILMDKVRFRGYAFQIEMKYYAWKKGFKLLEIPIVFTDRKLGSSKMSYAIVKESIFGVFQMRFSKHKITPKKS